MKPQLGLARIFLLEGLPADRDVDAVLRAILGMHVLSFAVADLTEELEERSPYAPGALAAWRLSLVGMVRAVCGLESRDGAA